MSLDTAVKKARKLIEESKKPLMFFDTDTDGTTSYIQLKRTFPKITGYPLQKDPKKQQELFDKIEKDFDLVIIFDIAFLEESFFEVFKGKKIIWADHHPSNDPKLIKRYKVHSLNPLNHDTKDNRPSSYLAYLVSDDERNLFYVSMGTVADFHLLDVITDLYERSPEEFNILFRLSEKKREELFTFIGRYKFNSKRKESERADWIRYLTYDCGLIRYKLMFDFLYKIDEKDEITDGIRRIARLDPGDLRDELSAGKSFPFDEIEKIYSKYRRYYRRAKERLDENGEKGKVMVYDYVGERGFVKAIVEELTYRLDDVKVIGICFMKRGGDFYQCSFRSNGVPLDKVIKKTEKGLKMRWGGHPYSMGVRIDKDDFEIFKKRLQD